MIRDKEFSISVITSDITYMKDTYCVAGLNPNTNKMKRLLIDGKHWTDNDLKRLGKYALLHIDVIPSEQVRDFPHRAEDIWISPDFKVLKNYDDPKKLSEHLMPSVSPSVHQAFNSKLMKGSYVPEGTKCPSLGAIIIPSNNLTFFKDGGKLRINFIDNDETKYDLRVTCKYLRDILDAMSSLDDFNS